MLIAGVFPDMSLKATYSLFTSFLEGEFPEVHIPDTGCEGPGSSARVENLPDIAPASRHLATLMDRYAPPSILEVTVFSNCVSEERSP
jgi:hypothetical protein